MALIVCPECGGKVSDKAKACIHCGYPMSELIETGKYKIILNAVGPNKVKVIKLVMDITGMDLTKTNNMVSTVPCNISASLLKEDADNIIAAFNKIGAVVTKEIDKEPNNDVNVNNFVQRLREMNSPVTCPKCGSTQIAWLPRGVKGYGSLFEHHVCKKCGYSWAV